MLQKAAVKQWNKLYLKFFLNMKEGTLLHVLLQGSL